MNNYEKISLNFKNELNMKNKNLTKFWKNI